jgi:predicted transposase YdaD
VATDNLFGDYGVKFPNALGKLIQAGADDFEAKSLTIKRAEKRADLFLISRKTKRIILVEPQGYKDGRLFHRMVATMMLFCLQHEYEGRMEASVIFENVSHWRAAESFFNRQFAGISTLKFSPRVIILRRIKIDELKKHEDVHLTPLYPLCDVTPTEIKQQAFDWAEQIRTAPALRKQDKENLLAFLGGAISHRIRKLKFNAISKLIGGFTMLDTPIGKEIMQMGMKKGLKKGMEKGMEKGVKKGIPQGAQHILLRQVAMRFGKVPDDVRRKIVTIKDTKKLDRIAVALLTTRSLAELKKAF